jgi:predicted RNase H-like nuclease
MNIVGIDCATDDRKIGVAVGRLESSILVLERASLCSKHERAAQTVSNWLQKQSGPSLLAIDAPLGWPTSPSKSLSTHRAGADLTIPAHQLFRRETDRFIKRLTNKTALDVGADRIARTAHAALQLLSEVRTNLELENIPLAWDHKLDARVSAIEVYPAATLVAHGFASTGYKKDSQRSVREQIISQISPLMRFDSNAEANMLANADVLDAGICLVAARDFLLGHAVPPEDKTIAEIEGWIWCCRKEST